MSLFFLKTPEKDALLFFLFLLIDLSKYLINEKIFTMAFEK